MLIHNHSLEICIKELQTILLCVQSVVSQEMVETDTVMCFCKMICQFLMICLGVCMSKVSEKTVKFFVKL